MNSDVTLSPPVELSAYNWRAIQDHDIPALHKLLAEASAVEKTDTAVSEGHIQRLLEMLGGEREKHTLLAMTNDGTVAAAGMIFMPPGEDAHVAMIEGTVHVMHRGRGLGNYMLHWMEARARQGFSNKHDGWPQTMRASCAGHQADRIALLEQRGFKAMRYAYKMGRTLAQPIHQRSLPDGLRLVQWDPALDHHLMDAFNQAFRGHWGLQTMNTESWRASFTGVPQFRGDLTYLAMDDDTIVGFCINWVNEPENVHNNTREGWVEAIGVLPAWRGRGVASCLLAHALALFRAEGFKYVALDVDAQNPTGALHLYKQHGFAVVKETISFVKALN